MVEHLSVTFDDPCCTGFGVIVRKNRQTEADKSPPPATTVDVGKVGVK